MSFYYRCSECGKEYHISAKRMLCDDCAHSRDPLTPLRGVLEVHWDHNIEWHQVYDLLPVPLKYFPSVPLDATPLWRSEGLSEFTGFPNLYLKDDTRQLTGSLKDRASLLVSAFAQQQQISHIVVASTGNAGSSMAGIGAAAGQKVTLFVPQTAPTAKLIQARQFGATVITVDGNYDKAYEESMSFSPGGTVMNRNTAYNPMTIEGKKTAALEIYIQLKKVPDIIFIPMGDGVILGGVYKGFEDLQRLSLIDKIPKLVGVQAEGSAAIHNAFTNGEFKPVKASTIADSIAVDVPKNGLYVLSKLIKHKGKTITVSDPEILNAQKKLSATSGLFVEPSSASVLAAFEKMKGEIDPKDTVVLLITGTGLKDIDAAAKALVEEK